METKKNFFNYIKNSYSNTTNFSNFKISRVFYFLALLLTLLFIPTVNAQADTGTKFEKIDIPFNLIKDKYYFMFSLGSTDSPYYYILIADSPIYMKLGDSDYHDPVYDDYMNSDWYYPTISPDTFDSKVSCYRLAPYDDDWTIAFKEFYFRDVEWNLYDSIYNQKKYLTNYDVIFVNGNYYSQGFNAPKNDNEVSYPYQPSLPGEEEPPVEETPTVGNESYIIINGEKVNVNYAIVQYLMRIEFIITLLFTVTVVFFIINKFWAWCRRLFSTSIR